jgi:polygalacturonase
MESYPGGIPQSGQEKVRYFGPGVHQAGEIRPQSGETIYLAGGSLVYGKIVADGVQGVRVLGRGILDGSKWKQWETSLIAFTNCSDVEIRGIVLRDSPAWTVVPRNCEHVTVADVKILNYRKNSDGINVVNCRNVIVTDCFVRNYDDSIVVKAIEADAPDVENIVVRNCVIWCDWGFSLGATYETRVEQIRGLLFQNCDVLHGMACRGVLGLKIGDRAMVRDVCFDDIRVEDARIQLLELVVDHDMFSKDVQRGHIQGVVFRNISLLGGAFVPSTFAGFDAEHCVENVTVENLRIHGKLVTSTEAGKIQTNAHVKNVRFLPGQ